MAKRIAEKELTDRNWDQEDEVEEVGTFSVASEEVLRSRAIKKAKRRNPGTEPDSGGAFQGFKGLVAPSGGGVVGFGTVGKPLEGLTNGTGISPLTSTPKVVLGTANGPASLGDMKGPKPRNGDAQQPPSGSAPGSAYHKQLAALNRSVRDWIVKHVDANPLCDLTPIFTDYEKYLAGIEQQHGGARSELGSEASQASGESEATSLFGAPKSQPAATFSFHTCDDSSEGASAKAEPAATSTSASFSFGKKVDSSVLTALSPTPLPGLSFPSSSASLFGKETLQNKPAASPFSKEVVEGQGEGGSGGKGTAEDEDSDEPPKVVVTEVKEEDAFYSKKCKLFYKKDDEFKEKGIGTLHLKPTANQKTQLLVRADTNLGNILLNVLVSPNMPCTRTGKNNVLIVCVPNPPLDDKNPSVPVPMLVRVKTAEDADELHRILLERRGGP